MRILETLRHDANDLITLAIKQQGAMKNIRGRAERGLPESVTDDGNFFAALLVVGGADGAAKLGRRLKGLEEISVDTGRAGALRGALRGEAEDGLAEGGHFLKRVAFLLQVIEVSVGGPEHF